MTFQSNRILSVLRRSDFSAFIMKVFETLHPGAPPLHRAWYIHAMCHALEEANNGQQRRLVITVPPRHLKSITTSVALVAWLLGHDPTLFVQLHQLFRFELRHINLWQFF